MTKAYLIDGVRTPIGNFAGSLSGVRGDDLAAHAIRSLIERHASLPVSEIDDVIFGCANQAGEDNRNVARMASLLAGLPYTVPGITVNRLCASGLSAALSASHAIKSGEGHLYIAGGVEQMTRAPYVLSKSATPFGRTAEMFDTTMGWRFINPSMKEQYGVDSMGETAEHVAQQFGISREDQDHFAFLSQQKAAAAQTRGRFVREIAPLTLHLAKGETKLWSVDEFIKPNTTLETLKKLRPAFKKEGSVTAGNASGINDGSCALLVASESAVERYGLQPKGAIVASAVSGVEPRIMGIGPVTAIQKLLRTTGLSLDSIDVIELNEAFAAQSLACIRELGLSDTDPRINPNGGAIALGHPLGMSGARLILTALHELEERKARYALCSMCVGVGQGVAALVERV